jgi:hypothetical protein
MNPLNWKREHQLALLGASLLGGILGVLLFSAVLARSYYPDLFCGFGYYGYACWLSGFWLRVFLWTAFGVMVGAAVVYIRQLLRS